MDDPDFWLAIAIGIVIGLAFLAGMMTRELHYLRNQRRADLARKKITERMQASLHVPPALDAAAVNAAIADAMEARKPKLRVVR